MTNEEALKYIADHSKMINAIPRSTVDGMERLKVAMFFDTARNALKKRIPKRVHIDTQSFYMGFEAHECPTCYTTLKVSDGYKYCPHCGQAIDWSE